MTIQYNLLKKYILILFGIGLCILILFVGITLYILPSGVVPKMIYENNKEEGFPGVYLLGLPNDYDMQKIGRAHV